MQKKFSRQRQRSHNKRPVARERFCYFCLHNIAEIDYRNIDILQKFTSNYQKILSRRRMGSCAHHQRQLGASVKRARFMALIPYMNDQR